MSQNLQNFAKFQKFQLDNLVDFEKCCQTRIYLQNFVLIQPKTSEILPKICQKLTSTLRIPLSQPALAGDIVLGRELGAAQRLPPSTNLLGRRYGPSRY